MFLSRLRLNLASREVRHDLADCQKLHCRIMSVFPLAGGPARADLGILFRLETHEREAVVFIQSRCEPDWSCLPPHYCLVGGTACKSVGSQYDAIADGTLLRFRLRANPTRRLKAGCPGEKRDGPRVDLRRIEDQLAWLHRKGETAGFSVLDVQVGDGVPDVTVVPEASRVRGHHRTGPLTFRGVLFEGHLQVRDAKRFTQALEDGIGTGRAYGFGLLSVAPAR